jgi:hypothetical protein
MITIFGLSPPRPLNLENIYGTDRRKSKKAKDKSWLFYLIFSFSPANRECRSENRELMGE